MAPPTRRPTSVLRSAEGDLHAPLHAPIEADTPLTDGRIRGAAPTARHKLPSVRSVVFKLGPRTSSSRASAAAAGASRAGRRRFVVRLRLVSRGLPWQVRPPREALCGRAGL